MWFVNQSSLFRALLALSVASQLSMAMTVAERDALEAEIAVMDFSDPAVPVHEMKEKLVKRMPVPDYVISDSARNYTPTKTDIYLTLPDGRYENLIFHDIELREREKKGLREFNEWLEKKKLTLPKGLDTEPDNIRIL